MSNCVYIFGNGFDLRMGMPTGYPDFLKYYATLSPNVSSVESTKSLFLSQVEENINKGDVQWKDLEIALGLFTKVVEIPIFKAFYRDISSALRRYLSFVEQHSPSISEEDRKKFWDDLMYPKAYLHTNLQKKTFSNTVSLGEVNADIISFNYTKTIETLLEDYLDKDFYYSEPSTSDLYRVKSIKHLHGELGNSDISDILFGVNDISQIANEQFREDESIQDLLVKPKGNAELGVNIDKECISLIQRADVFYIFGTSLGPTDQYWWNVIGDRIRITTNAVILYFAYDPKGLEKNMLNREYISLERDIRKRILKIMNISGLEKDYRNRIYIACNSDIFPAHPQRKIMWEMEK